MQPCLALQSRPFTPALRMELVKENPKKALQTGMTSLRVWSGQAPVRAGVQGHPAGRLSQSWRPVRRLEDTSGQSSRGWHQRILVPGKHCPILLFMKLWGLTRSLHDILDNICMSWQ
jgi:hypothetical protein